MPDRTTPHRNGTVPVMAKAENIKSSQARATTFDLHNGNEYYTQVAQKYWLNQKKTPAVKPVIVKDELWDKLEQDNFAYPSLLALENLQLLELYLWPGYSDSSSNHHVLLLALLVTVKGREGLPAWSLFESKPAEFTSFFRRVLSMTVDLSLPINLRKQLICFVITAFQSLDHDLVRKECAPLVSISIWQNLHNDQARDDIFNAHLRLGKVWRAAGRKYDGADEATKASLRFDRSWLYTLIVDFLNQLYRDAGGDDGKSSLMFCERFIELLIDLQSQLPTRRYVNTLIKDLHVLPAIRLSPIYSNESNGLLRDLYFLLEHFTRFPIDSHEEKAFSSVEYHDVHCKKLARLQRIGYKSFENKLRILALSNFGNLGRREELESNLSSLTDDELVDLCSQLGLRTQYPDTSSLARDRSFFLEVIAAEYELKQDFQEVVRDLAVLPSENELYQPALLRDERYNGARPLAIPKLNLQYLTVGDFLSRSFVLHRSEAFNSIRADVEIVIKRLQPKTIGGATRFSGSTRMALPIQPPAVVDIVPPQVGQFTPAQVRIEVLLDVSRLSFHVRREWESLRAHDVVFLLAIHPADKHGQTNGNSSLSLSDQKGLQYVRSAEVIEVQNEKGRSIRTQAQQEEQNGQRQRQRRLILALDTHAFKADQELKERTKTDVYQAINVVMRRRSRENNFKAVLESIKRLTLSDVPTPSWLQNVFLGYGDPAMATYKRMSNRLKTVDFRDTFLDWQHLVESLPGKVLEPSDDAESSFGPPYVLEALDTAPPAVEQQRPSKKRRRDAENSDATAKEVFRVSTYKPPNTGPYPVDMPKLNTIRFTTAQVEAITSGAQPGLTIIVGPPGTGKTDVATQIISNLYHNFPHQRTLLIAHSNQALNQLFQKIIALDIDERHLLRLGHGEEELASDANFSKHGRVESFLERGTSWLSEVTRLAASIDAPGAHGSSCETADYFNHVYIEPMWSTYWDSIQTDTTSVDTIVESFPFHTFFSNAPQPLFGPDTSREEALDVARGCYRHIEKIFTELADVRPFEILRHARDKANYLLVKEARIVAMTSTHAAMRRQEIADLGFHYDNVVMEEAAQITEIENFIPLALQKPRDGELPLQRIVLVGDHLQNAPIIQSLAFRQYSHLDQSLFLRLIRLGAPHIMLDQQGRARPSIAELYHWRYPGLKNLPSVASAPEFQSANAGFKYDYQFIDISHEDDRGEAEPTPHFMINKDEAEYAVALYMYMRLLGYPASKISILAMYAGQVSLIKDVLAHHCKAKALFGLPRHVSTVDKFQGEQNDYVILSLVRTSRPGYIRDLRRLTVALSRARLGLYVLGRRSVFENVYELQPAFAKLLARPTQLLVTTGEMYGRVTRSVDDTEDKVTSTPIVNLQHLGQFVSEMTKAKVAALQAGEEVLPAVETRQEAVEGDDSDGDSSSIDSSSDEDDSD